MTATNRSNVGRGKNRIEVCLKRSVRIPDKLRLARYRKTPEYGPRVLFFSGGTAMNGTSRELTEYTHNSIHLITPFDSGGSSARLRDAFGVLGVGDFRSRLLALADQSVKGQGEIFGLLSSRLPKDGSSDQLRKQLLDMVDGEDPRVSAIMDPMRKIIRNHLRYFYEEMPEDFDLRGASVGNLALVGGYLNNARDIEPAIFLLSQLVEVRGVVRPIVDDSLHLTAELVDGTRLVGQHRMTGKEVPPIQSPIRRVYLVHRLSDPRPAEVSIDEKVRRLIAKADLICFPMGSFFSSIVANLLPRGVGDAVGDNGCPKTYISNLGTDPEAYGMSLADRVEVLLKYLRAGASREMRTDELLNVVLIDNGDGGVKVDEIRAVRDLGIDVVDCPLVTERSAPYIDPAELLPVLMSLT
ncbi:MAG: GAK system CofD-like protein [Phycisphaerae bacterium]|jgi:CofD-related protein of GAK system